MPKKSIQVPKLGSDEADGSIQLTMSELLELTRKEHAARIAQMGINLASAQQRAVRLEIEQAARASSEGIIRAQSELDAALADQKSFAEALAKRYDFDWKTHSYCSETGVVRRLIGD